ncbi:related to mating type protein [Phialocephala subalpina]|uniref:Related to mating type protein n=1 Tax=Phialocephala subalpina TaxID=576137 RepID=A0A1L7WJ25_9HELO|nr:related to mating type protein [Phialocephala subalpina]
MSVSTELGHSNLHTPRSPVSISTDSSRRGSLKQVLPEKQSEPQTPSSPQHRLTRKRAASLDTDIANEPRIGDLALNSARLAELPTSDPTKEQVCLCQPDPKIPRPRNAFILYRQHYQAQVVAQHPGLANPEISKIIGEQWREQAPEIKNDWKRLAEVVAQHPGLANPEISKIIGEQWREQAPEIKNDWKRLAEAPRMDTPRHPPPFQQQQLMRRGYGPPQQLQTHRERDEGMDLLSPSSGQKRRRFNEENHRGYAANSPVSYSAPQAFARNGAPPMPMSAGYRQPLPGPSMLVKNGSMGPPPAQYSPVVPHPRQQYHQRQSVSIMDESLRLPPIQTQISNGGSGPQRSDARAESRESQAKSIEAMVMTIPYINKIKVLTKISPPLSHPGPGSPTLEVRGAVIAVEGADKELLSEIGSFINEYLSKDPSFAVRVWGTTASPAPVKPASTPSSDTEMAEASTAVVAPKPAETTDEIDNFVEYLSIISQWHKKSDEVSKYITTAPIPPSTKTNTDSAQALAPKPKILPVALVPTGFSLTTSDTFALRIPINDSYAPVDHWQWMATLWRGIVGPDLTIYVTRVGPDEMNRLGGVEIRNDCQAIVVRIAETGKMDEKTARRLGFEVVEIVRNIESGFGRS